MTSKTSESTPVIIGVGQVTDTGDALNTPTGLTVAALAAAEADAGVAVRDRLDALFCTPSTVFAGDHPADQLAAALGIAPTTRVASTFSGAGPLKLLAQACAAVTSGARVALVGGAIADASVKRAARRGVELPAPPAAPWSQGTKGRPDDTPEADVRHFRGAETAAGISLPAEIFALIESVFAHEMGHDPVTHRAALGHLMAPFTTVAASHPDRAWFPVARRAEELSTPSDDNRLVAEPYPKRMTSFPIVDQAAVLLVTSAAEADRLGVPEHLRVHPWSLAGRSEFAMPSRRPVMHRSTAMREAVRVALGQAGRTIDDMAFLDLYSCFPAAVQMGVDAIGLPFDTDRSLTLTGGLPYFGGPGAGYVTHALAFAVEACRARPDDTGLVVGLGGAPNDFAAAVLGSAAPSHTFAADVVPRAEDEPADAVTIVAGREGKAVVEAMTVAHHREQGPVRVIAIVRYDDGARAGVRQASVDMARQLAGTSLVGQRVPIALRDGHAVLDV
jgi:acetyl-CoA C-acetyltransferase